MIITLLMLLNFMQLAGTDDVSLKANDPKSYITYKDIFHTQLEQYTYFIDSLKEYFNNIGDITKVLGKTLNKYDINDEADLILMHIIFVKTQLDMMKKRVPELERTHKLLYSELSLYGG